MHWLSWEPLCEPSFYVFITKTCLYNFDPLKPHFYIVKLRFTRVYIIFSYFCSKNINCGYLLEPPHRGGSNEYPQSMFWAETWKISEFFIWKFSFFGRKIFSIFEYSLFQYARFHQKYQGTCNGKQNEPLSMRCNYPWLWPYFTPIHRWFLHNQYIAPPKSTYNDSMQTLQSEHWAVHLWCSKFS